MVQRSLESKKGYLFVHGKSAIARKYQEIYAGLDNADITDYDFSGGRYKKLLEKNNYKIKEKVWKRVDMGNVTLDH